MDNRSLDRATNLVKAWDTRVFIVVSLLIQVVLTLLAPRRKHSKSSFLKFALWILYLSADAVAILTIGLIVNNLGDFSQDEGAVQNADLQAFWAPFLLIHLGGPDTITALAMEDTELWHRHALQLGTQLAMTIYVFVRTTVGGMNDLWLPTLLIFVDGFIKYSERTCALYAANMDHLRDSVRNQARQGYRTVNYFNPEEGVAENRNGTTTAVGSILQRGFSKIENWRATAPSAHWYQVEETYEMVKYSYDSYIKFKRLVGRSMVHTFFSNKSRAFFTETLPNSEAFRIAEIELNFTYDFFYTKVFLLHKKLGYARVLSFFSVVASLVLFCSKDKSNYSRIDVGVTFALLGGAIALDILGALMFVFSDWWIIITSCYEDDKKLLLSSLILLLNRLRSSFRDSSIRVRWCQTIPQYCVLSHCLKGSPSYLKYVFVSRMKDLLIGKLYVKHCLIDERLGNLIIDQIREKARVATRESGHHRVSLASSFPTNVLNYLPSLIHGKDFDQDLLTWHLATDICYWITTTPDNKNRKVHHRLLSKRISDYMPYLLLRQRALVSHVAGIADFRFQRTFEHVQRHIYETSSQATTEGEITLEWFCHQLLLVTEVDEFRGVFAKSVLGRAHELARQLMLLGDEQWEITSKVWVEMLCFAALGSPPRSHFAQLSRGGELITVVWLMLAHFGLGEHFSGF